MSKKEKENEVRVSARPSLPVASSLKTKKNETKAKPTHVSSRRNENLVISESSPQFVHESNGGFFVSLGDELLVVGVVFDVDSWRTKMRRVSESRWRMGGKRGEEGTNEAK